MANDSKSAAPGCLDQNSSRSVERKNTSHACDECRRRRIKCNGELPCSRCIDKSMNCSYENFVKLGDLRSIRPKVLDYTTLLQQKAILDQLIASIQSGNETRILEMIREGVSLDVLAQHLNEPDSQGQDDEYQTTNTAWMSNPSEISVAENRDHIEYVTPTFSTVQRMRQSQTLGEQSPAQIRHMIGSGYEGTILAGASQMTISDRSKRHTSQHSRHSHNQLILESEVQGHSNPPSMGLLEQWFSNG